MTVVIRIGARATNIFWALISLFGVILASNGVLSIFSYLVDINNSVAISHVSGGILVFIIGLVAVCSGYLGIRGRIIITTTK